MKKINENFIPKPIEALIPFISKRIVLETMEIIENNEQDKYIFRIKFDRQLLKAEIKDTFKDFPIVKLTIILNVNTKPSEYGIEVGGGFISPIQPNKKAANNKMSYYIGNDLALVIELDIFTAAQENNINFKVKLYQAVSATISHELTHAYEAFTINKKKDKTNSEDLWAVNNLYYMSSKHEDTSYNSWNELMALIYLAQKHEINARMVEYFQSLKVGIEKIQNKEEYEEMLKFDGNKYYDILLKDITATHKFNKKYTVEEKIIRLINKFILAYLKFSKNDEDVLSEKLAKFKDKPLAFLKFWEREFHYKAKLYFDNLNRKIKKYKEFHGK